MIDILPALALLFFLMSMFVSFSVESINYEFIDHRILNVTGIMIPCTLFAMWVIFYILTPGVPEQTLTQQIDSLQNIISQQKETIR